MLENDCRNRNLFRVCVSFIFLMITMIVRADVELPFRLIRFIVSQIQLGFWLKSDFKNWISTHTDKWGKLSADGFEKYFVAT